MPLDCVLIHQLLLNMTQLSHDIRVVEGTIDEVETRLPLVRFIMTAGSPTAFNDVFSIVIGRMSVCMYAVVALSHH